MVFLWCRREIQNYFLSSTPDEDHVSKAFVFLVVLYVRRIGEYISLKLYYFVSLTSRCSLIPL